LLTARAKWVNTIVGLPFCEICAKALLDLADERFYVLRSDKRGEFGTESQLLAPEVADFIDARMEHVTLAQEARGIPQKSTLLFARKLCGIFGPGDEFQMLVVVA